MLGATETTTFATSDFATPETINLTADLVLSNSEGVTIEGPGAGILTISGGGTSQVFQVDQGATASLSGLTITGGWAQGGGGLYNAGSTTLSDCTVTGNVAAEGAGLVNRQKATLILDGCTISANYAEVSGGGLYNGGTATFSDCTISTNSASLGGGGMLGPGTAAFFGCTIDGNSAPYSSGGGLLSGGTIALTDCTISGNSAADGGGLYTYGSGTATLVFCTISGNSAPYGGGLCDDGVPAGSSSNVVLTDSIIAGNTDSGGNSPANDIGGPSAGAVKGSYDLIGPGGSGGVLTTSGDTGNIALAGNETAGLGALGDYGGPTETMALLPGSPAIDAGAIADYPGTFDPDQHRPARCAARTGGP